MAKEEARGDEIAAAAARNPVTCTSWKRKRTGGASGSPGAASGGAGMCDDVLRGIFARVPARTAVASMAVSRHHQALLRCPEFRALHCLLAPSLPDPHVAYVATAKVRRSGSGGRSRKPQRVSGYHGFHVAGAGLSRGSGAAPMRALAGATCRRMKYVSTCHGVVLLPPKDRPATCVLWNPAVADEVDRPATCVLWNRAVADEVEEVRVPVSDDDECAVLGLGYGLRTKTYKLLLSRRPKMTQDDDDGVVDAPEDDVYGGVDDDDYGVADAPEDDNDDGVVDAHRKEGSSKKLLVYALSGSGGGDDEQPRLRTLLSEGLDGEISGESLFLDGTIYLLHVDKAVILAFDVDDETVTAIDLAGEHGCKIMSSRLLLISGRPCVDTKDSHGRALWLLTADHRWERKCFIEDEASIVRRDHLDPYSVAGVWDFGGVLFMYLRHQEDGKLFMYCTATRKMIEVDLPRTLTPPEGSEYATCWGYRPTLVSPGSMVGGEIDQDEEKRRARTADVMAALTPLVERDRRKGHKATLHTVCFMEFLVRIMQKLPENMTEVAEMPLLKHEGSGKELYYADSDPDSYPDKSFEAKFMWCFRKTNRRRRIYN